MLFARFFNVLFQLRPLLFFQKLFKSIKYVAGVQFTVGLAEIWQEVQLAEINHELNVSVLPDAVFVFHPPKSIAASFIIAKRHTFRFKLLEVSLDCGYDTRKDKPGLAFRFETHTKNVWSFM